MKGQAMFKAAYAEAVIRGAYGMLRDGRIVEAREFLKSACAQLDVRELAQSMPVMEHAP